jgi:hypothetical protein
MFELIFNSKATLGLSGCLEIKKVNFVDILLSKNISYIAYPIHRDTLIGNEEKIRTFRFRRFQSG